MGRLTRECVITEKIDGTNAQVVIAKPGVEDHAIWPFVIAERVDEADGLPLVMLAGSRTRYITPGKGDNMGFAGWVQEHADELFALGPGRHFGEWWGGKIQRGYGLTEKRFSLFNTGRWASPHGIEPFPLPEKQVFAPRCCHVVPVLYQGLFGEKAVENMMARLKHEGSVAAPGFMNPEGIVIFHTATSTMFKKTLDNDEQPKGRTS